MPDPNVVSQTLEILQHNTEDRYLITLQIEVKGEASTKRIGEQLSLLIKENQTENSTVIQNEGNFLPSAGPAPDPRSLPN